jgi:hypothetical protein
MHHNHNGEIIEERMNVRIDQFEFFLLLTHRLSHYTAP